MSSKKPQPKYLARDAPAFYSHEQNKSYAFGEGKVAVGKIRKHPETGFANNVPGVLQQERQTKQECKQSRSEKNLIRNHLMLW